MRSVALLRGVNVGGARTLPMAALEHAFKSAGARTATTVLQSGNVVFEADDSEAVSIATAKAIEAQFGFHPAIIVRSASAWRAMVEANPFITAGLPATELHVACLASAPHAADAARLRPESFLPDAFVLTGSDIYLRLPNGVAKANLSNARLDRALATVSTLRNWRTVLKLMERLEA
jgi:uncharacterized protein (DUF1697 family)